MPISRSLALSVAALLMITQGAAAQDWQQRKQRPQGPPQQQQQQQATAVRAGRRRRSLLAERLCAALAQLLDQYRRLPAHAGDLQSRLVLPLNPSREDG